MLHLYPGGIYLFKVKDGNSIIMHEIFKAYNKVIDVVLVFILTSLWTDFTHCSGISIVNFEQVNAIYVHTKLHPIFWEFESNNFQN